MNKFIYILHKSRIVSLGLKSIIRSNLKISVRIIGNFEEIKDIIYSKGSLNILMIDSELTERDEYININKSIFSGIIKISESLEKKDEELMISINSTENEICNKIRKQFDIIDIKTSYAQDLTKREIDVLKLVAIGLSNKEIANKLFISTHTVISHRKNITEKLGIKSISGLTVYAIISNYLDTENLNIEDLI